MEAFLRYARETRDARAPDYRPHPLASPVTPSPTDRTTLAFSSRVPRANNLFVHPLNRSETQRPRARGVLPPLHGAGHGRRGRGAHLEAAGHRPRDRRYGLQPGVRVVAPEMRDPMRCAITCRSFFVFFLGVRFATFAAIVNRRGALVFPSSRETKRAVFSDIHNI